MKQAQTQQFKVLRWKDGEKSPDNLSGHIIVFDDPLMVYLSNKPDKDGWTSMIPKGNPTECNFMRAEGGFGCYEVCSGRMIVGKYFKTIQDVIDNKPFQSGNTKCFPDGFIPELFTKHEKL